jgi:hypothetical protein
MHYSRDVNILLRSLGEQGAGLRRAIESLKQNPIPDWAMELPESPGSYEWLVGGYWVMYSVDRANPSETVLRMVVLEPN